MDKYIYDMNNWPWYKLQGDYYIPCFTLPAEEQKPIGILGCGSPVETSDEVRSTDRAGRRDQRHKRYLKEYKKATYTTLFTSGKLNTYLADIDKQAQERFERLTEQMKQAQGITERLKEENALEWVGRMNNIRACARKIVEEEIIYA